MPFRCRPLFSSYEVLWGTLGLTAYLFFDPSLMGFSLWVFWLCLQWENRSLIALVFIFSVLRIFQVLSPEPIASTPRGVFKVIVESASRWSSVARIISIDEKPVDGLRRVKIKSRPEGQVVKGNAELIPIASYEAPLYKLKERNQEGIVSRLNWLQNPEILSAVHPLRQKFLEMADSPFEALENFRKAVFLGQSDALSPKLWDALNILGLSHAAVVSGSHLTGLVGMISFVGRILPMGWISFRLLIVGLVIFFSWLCSSDIPLWRALLCFLLTYVLTYFFPKLHRISAPDRLAAVGFLMAFWNPPILWTPGYQLSFLLTWILLRLHRPTPLTLCMVPTIMSWIILSVYHLPFHPISMLMNCLVLPALTILLVPLSLISIWVRPLEGFANGIITKGEVFLIYLSDHLRFFGWAIWLNGYFSMVCLVIGLMIIRTQRDVSRRLCFLLFVGVSLTFLNFKEYRSSPSLEVVDIGQGDALRVLFEDQAISVDGGEARAGMVRMLEKAYRPAVKNSLWLLTHFDKDHWGFFKDYFPLVSAKTVFVPRWDRRLPSGGFTYERVQGRNPQLCGRDYCVQFWARDNYRAKSKPSNADSVVSILYEVHSHKIIGVSTGDLEARGERELVDFLRHSVLRVPEEGVSFLKLGHHGSKTSTSEELLSLLRPKIGIITVGRMNRYGHPHQEVLQRLEQRRAEIFRTDQIGDFKVFF